MFSRRRPFFTHVHTYTHTHTAPLCTLSVVANTTAASASWALVIHAFVPFNNHVSPLSTAVVLAAPASLPLPGSDSPKHPNFSPDAYGVRNSAACSGVQLSSTGPQ